MVGRYLDVVTFLENPKPIVLFQFNNWIRFTADPSFDRLPQCIGNKRVFACLFPLPVAPISPAPTRIPSKPRLFPSIFLSNLFWLTEFPCPS